MDPRAGAGLAGRQTPLFLLPASIAVLPHVRDSSKNNAFVLGAGPPAPPPPQTHPRPLSPEEGDKS